jgi:hypothetical protein
MINKKLWEKIENRAVMSLEILIGLEKFKKDVEINLLKEIIKKNKNNSIGFNQTYEIILDKLEKLEK